jgi:hypothetical protein
MMSLPTSGNLTLGGTISSSTINAINTLISNLQTSKLDISNYIVPTRESLQIDQTNNT